MLGPLRPLQRRLLLRITVDDPWERVPSLFVTPQIFGSGSFRKFSWYLEGQTAVQVQAVNDLCRWLAECQYLPDDQLFNERDFWQHPRTFEHLRKGDCEDHALWAWRKLIELEYPAQLFVGQWFEGGGDRHDCHAWVVFDRDGELFLLEAVCKEHDAMVRRLCDVHAEYCPHFSVDHQFTMHSYAGYLLYLQERARRENARSA
jgi:hypothetical protein